MMKPFLTLLFSLSIVLQTNAQCFEEDVPRILLVGDSWAAFMHSDESIGNALNRWGHSDISYTSNFIVAENGADTWDFLDSEKQDEIESLLLANPSIDLVHLSIGGNDVLGDWNVSFTQAMTDSMEEAVSERLIDIIEFIEGVRPDVRIVWSGYTYPNFEEVIEGIAPAQAAHPFYSLWSDMQFPNFLQLNEILNRFSDSVYAYALTDPRVDFVKCTGILQYTYGQEQPLGVAPGGTYPPFTVPLPEGDPTYPSPQNSMRDYGFFTDCFHLHENAYADFMDYQFQKFYHKHLMDDQYFLSEGGTADGSVSTAGTTSGEITIGNMTGEDEMAMLSFNTATLPDTTLSAASIFLRRQSGTGNPIGAEVLVSVKSPFFGTSASVEVEDLTSQGDATEWTCRFGSNGSDDQWIRLELPPEILPFIPNNDQVQFRISTTNTVDESATFYGASDQDFAPVLNVTYGPNPPASINESTATTGISIYPNPATDRVFIDMESELIERVLLFDQSGRLLISEARKTSVDVSSLNAGTYLLRVETGESSSHQKLIIR